MAENQQTKSPKSARRKREELSCRLESQKPAPTQVSPSDHDAAICTKRPHQSLAIVYVKSGNPMTSPTPIRRAQPGFLSPVPLPCSDAAASIVVVPCGLPAAPRLPVHHPNRRCCLPKPSNLQHPRREAPSSCHLPLPLLPSHLISSSNPGTDHQAVHLCPDQIGKKRKEAQPVLPCRNQSLSPPPSMAAPISLSAASLHLNADAAMCSLPSPNRRRNRPSLPPSTREAQPPCSSHQPCRALLRLIFHRRYSNTSIRCCKQIKKK
ncbi:hypothetical protein M0R45_006539 [Rubus argutus]|uniref:Uncharacterized protein n=1 Tax=Rubus argutus TaxID=59490 RepID=A0AAW1YQW3_RUBAR